MQGPGIWIFAVFEATSGREGFGRENELASTAGGGQRHESLMAQPEQGLQRIGAAQLHINSPHTQADLRRHFQQFEPHTADRGFARNQAVIFFTAYSSAQAGDRSNTEPYLLRVKRENKPLVIRHHFDSVSDLSTRLQCRGLSVMP